MGKVRQLNLKLTERQFRAIHGEAKRLETSATEFVVRVFDELPGLKKQRDDAMAGWQESQLLYSARTEQVDQLQRRIADLKESNAKFQAMGEKAASIAEKSLALAEQNRKEAEKLLAENRELKAALALVERKDRKLVEQGGGSEKGEADSGLEILVALGLTEAQIAERRSLPEEEQVEALGRYWLVVKALARVGRIPRKAVFPLVGISDEDLRHFVLFDATEEEKKRLRDALLGSEEKEVKHGRRKGA